MIERSNPNLTAGIKSVWRQCFTNEDDRYTEFFFRLIYKPEYGYAITDRGRVVSTLCRIPHAIMFNGRVLATSMIVGVATVPDARNKGHMHDLMDTVLDACTHSELITLIQAYEPALYEPYGFRMIYNRSDYTVTRLDVQRITNVGCAYDPSPIDMLKCYSAFISRFNGFYARDLEYFVRYKKEITAQGGKIVAYYDSKGQIRGYASVLFGGKEATVEECVYLDSMSLMKLINAALQERPVVHVMVSAAENLNKLIPNAQRRDFGSTMARLNNPELFSRLFGTEVRTVEEAFALSSRPLNLNEFA